MTDIAVVHGHRRRVLSKKEARNHPATLYSLTLTTIGDRSWLLLQHSMSLLPILGIGPKTLENNQRK